MTRPKTHRMGLAIVSGSKPITGPGWIDFDGGLEVVVDRSRSKLLVCLLALSFIHAQRTRHPLLSNTRDKGGRHVKARGDLDIEISLKKITPAYVVQLLLLVSF